MEFGSCKTDYSGYRPEGFPVRHRRKVPFDPKLSLNLEYRRMIAEIRRLDGELGQCVLSDKDYAKLAGDALSDNIHWSTKVEGNTLSPEEVKVLARAFLDGRVDDDVSPLGREIINHLIAHFSIDTFELPWTVDTVRNVHSLLMAGTNDQIDPGELRTKDVCIMADDGFELFIACPAVHVGEELDSLLEWLNNSPFDELITSVLFYHEFESIHPFLDGNGRTGRMLFQILMRRLGLRNIGLCMFERELLSDWSAYCDLLGYADATGNYAPLVMYCTESLLISYRDATQSFKARDQSPELDGYQKLIVRKARSKSRFTIKEANQWIPEVGDQTLRSRLDDLVNRGLLKKQGATRGMSYAFDDPFSEIRWKINGELIIDELDYFQSTGTDE